MSANRPTFHESWYRVTTLRPRLRTTIQTYRQHFRGEQWHVVQDPSNNQYLRLTEAGYHFVGLLDGKRTVEEAWRICTELFGDEAPTQGEAINLLGQLYTSNLLQSDLPADAAGMFDNYRNRVQREVRGLLMSLLFVRLPLYDPDALLARWERIVGPLFSRAGLVGWLVLLAVAGFSVIGRVEELSDAAGGVLAPGNLFLLYVSFTFVKAVHELGHGIATKHIGRRSGTGGEVHVMGITLLAFTPVPYVDCSSAWAYRSKWHRALVGAAGMYVELAVASIAAVVWANTSPGTVHAIAYNMMFVASISTLLFNGNPLLRFDGYYIFSDLLEVPNLARRSRDHLIYLIRRYAYGLGQAVSPAVAPGEHRWLPVYAVASLAYRVVIITGLTLFLGEKLFILGAIFAIVSGTSFVLLPFLKMIRYLLASPELMRVRPRALLTTTAFFVVVLGALGGLPAPDRARAEGVVEPEAMAMVYAEVDGFVESVLPAGHDVTPEGAPLLVARNVELETKRERLLARRRLTELERDRASMEEFALTQSLGKRLAALDEQIAQVDRQLASLAVHAPVEGLWIAPDAERFHGAFVERGDLLGLVADTDTVLIRAVTDQRLGPRIEPEIGSGGVVELRVRGRPDLAFTGRVREVLPGGFLQLPSAALGYVAGGAMAVETNDTEGTTSVDPFFEVHIELDPETARAMSLCSGQRVMVRFEMPSRPLLVQWARSLRQLVQRRFGR